MSSSFPYLDSWLRRARTRAQEQAEADARVRARLPQVVRCLVEEFGCSEVLVFGSLVEGGSHAGSDVDLAVRGMPRARYFHALARLAHILGRDVDLVELETARPALARRITESAEVLYRHETL